MLGEMDLQVGFTADVFQPLPTAYDKSIEIIDTGEGRCRRCQRDGKGRVAIVYAVRMGAQRDGVGQLGLGTAVLTLYLVRRHHCQGCCPPAWPPAAWHCCPVGQQPLPLASPSVPDFDFIRLDGEAMLVEDHPDDQDIWVYDPGATVQPLPSSSPPHCLAGATAAVHAHASAVRAPTPVQPWAPLWRTPTGGGTTPTRWLSSSWRCRSCCRRCRIEQGWPALLGVGCKRHTGRAGLSTHGCYSCHRSLSCHSV